MSQGNANTNYDAGKYWTDIFAQDIDAKSVCYPDWPLSYNQFLHQQQVEKLIEILQKYSLTLEGKSILEIGPGSGFWTNFFHQNKVEKYTGIDISKHVTDKLQQQFPAYNFQNFDVGEIENSSQTIVNADLIFVAMVLLHITDDKKIDNAFSFFSQKLNPGGHFILLDSIASKNVFGHMKMQAEGPEFNEEFHNKIRMKETIANIAKKYNLEILDVVPAFNTSQMCFDFNTYIGYLIWGKLFYAFHRRVLHNASENFGKKYAAFQSLLDNFLTNTMGMSMSSKWIVFRKMNS